MTRWTAMVAAVAIAAAACGGEGAEPDGAAATASTVASSTTTSEPTDAAEPTTTTTEPADVDLDVLEQEGGVSIAVAASTSLIWMTTDAEVCSPAGPDRAAIRARVTAADDPVTAVIAVVRPADADGDAEPLATLDLQEDGDGWATTIGPFEARRSSEDRTADVTVSATTESGRVFDTRFGLEVRAPVRCEDTGSSGDDSGDTGTPSTTTTTTAAPTTTPPPSSTTAAPTTTTTTIPVTASVSVSPAEVTASGGPCAEPGDVLTVSVTTAGTVARVGAEISLETGASQLVELSGGPDSWSTSVGPFAGAAAMPASSTISIVVTVRPTAGPDVVTSTTATLLRPC